MSQNIPMSTKASVTDAATPANTPLNVAPISSRGQVAEGGRPTVTTVDEEEGEDGEGEGEGLEGGNPASVLARVSVEREAKKKFSMSARTFACLIYVRNHSDAEDSREMSAGWQ